MAMPFFGRGSLSGFGTMTLAAGSTLDASASGCRIILDGSTTLAATPPLTYGGDLDTGHYRSAANTVATSGNGAQSSNTTPSQFNLPGNVAIGSAIYIPEGSAPGAIANYAAVYAIDVASKTQLTVLFPTGAAQQVKIEA